MGSSAPVELSAAPSFDEQFTRLFSEHFHRIFRFLDRLTGDPELAADIAQDVFLRLHRRRSVPDRPEAWLITVALNLFRNARSTSSRRRALLTHDRAARLHADPPAGPAAAASAAETARLVRAALDGLADRDRDMLLLRAEGYAYRDIAAAVDVNEASVGTLLARARAAFRDAYREVADAH